MKEGEGDGSEEGADGEIQAWPERHHREVRGAAVGEGAKAFVGIAEEPLGFHLSIASARPFLPRVSRGTCS
jgi:hypothetical protein